MLMANENIEYERSTLFRPPWADDSVVKTGAGDAVPVAPFAEHFDSAESMALDRLIRLKEQLRTLPAPTFWSVMSEELTAIIGSQCTFVSKRMLFDEQNAAVEMPPLGEPGSCLMGVALYFNNGADVKSFYPNHKYEAFCTPCAYMKHEKVLVIPERLSDFIPNNPNAFPWKTTEAYIGIPLFDGERCFGHFGMMWSSEGAAKRRLSWTFIEMLLHSVEDLILKRLLEGSGFSENGASDAATNAGISLNAISATQSLKPYARNLSHELRTPMHGVVGMLDMMGATVNEAITDQRDPAVKNIFEELKKNIDVVQESSKRAVEAADNVVHAYDLGMQMPSTPLKTDEDVEPMKLVQCSEAASPCAGPTTPGPQKRDRLTAELPDTDRPAKKVVIDYALPLEVDDAISPEVESQSSGSTGSPRPVEPSPLPEVRTSSIVSGVIREALESDRSRETASMTDEQGETMTVVRVDAPEKPPRTLRVSIDSDVPKTIELEEDHLRFSLTKVVHNAFKFTESGSITISVKLSRGGSIVEIYVADTGCGIDKESQLHLFKPYFQSDPSIARQKEGLGLSLFNAKAYVRKHLGGDITLERSDTDGPRRGSEFLVRIPLIPSPDGSRAVSPVPTPQRVMATPTPASPAVNGLPTTPSTPGQSSTRPVVARPTVMRAGHDAGLAQQVPLHILVAEDNLINRTILISYLKKLGYAEKNIMSACDGVEAVARYKESLAPSATRFTAVLMDLWMPNMDGYQATEEILRLAAEHDDHPQVIAVTADITNQSQERARTTGMTGFIAKPYKVMDIQNMITANFQKSEGL